MCLLTYCEASIFRVSTILLDCTFRLPLHAASNNKATCKPILVSLPASHSRLRIGYTKLRRTKLIKLLNFYECKYYVHVFAGTCLNACTYEYECMYAFVPICTSVHVPIMVMQMCVCIEEGKVSLCMPLLSKNCMCLFFGGKLRSREGLGYGICGDLRVLWSVRYTLGRCVLCNVQCSSITDKAGLV